MPPTPMLRGEQPGGDFGGGGVCGVVLQTVGSLEGGGAAREGGKVTWSEQRAAEKRHRKCLARGIAPCGGSQKEVGGCGGRTARPGMEAPFVVFQHAKRECCASGVTVAPRRVRQSSSPAAVHHHRRETVQRNND